jgi:hypothetical protein
LGDQSGSALPELKHDSGVISGIVVMLNAQIDLITILFAKVKTPAGDI